MFVNAVKQHFTLHKLGLIRHVIDDILELLEIVPQSPQKAKNLFLFQIIQNHQFLQIGVGLFIRAVFSILGLQYLHVEWKFKSLLQCFEGLFELLDGHAKMAFDVKAVMPVTSEPQ